MEKDKVAISEKGNCYYCRTKKLPLLILDEDGTLSSLSGKSGRPSHAYDVYFWPCRNYRKIRNKNEYKYIGPKEIK